MYCVYILYSPKLDRFYIGKTSDFDTRLSQHLGGKSTFTKRANDWIPVGRFPVDSSSDADLLERRIKRSKSRKTILRFLKADNNIVKPNPGLPS